MSRLLITGATGSLGRHLYQRAVAADWDTIGTSLSTPGFEPLDIRDQNAVHHLLRASTPDVVIHTAAGRDRNDWPCNASGAAHIAVATAAAGIRLVHMSSDAIFSGRDIHYPETAQPDPIYPYGAAKAAAETAVRAIHPTAAIVRTSLIVGDDDGHHERLTRDLIAGRVTGALFTDEFRMPVHVGDLSDALLELAANDYSGVLNVAGAEPISRYKLGVLVAHREGLDPDAIPGAVSPPGRPTNVRLSGDRARGVLQTRLRGVTEFLK